jgi:outer membrane putative beta-barrel porin/alpha-amylase
MVYRRIRALTQIVVALFIIAGLATAAAAQTEATPNLSSLLPELILREIRLPTSSAGLSHDAHFSPFTVNELQNPAVAVVEGFNQLLVVQLSTFPIGSSAGGFSYSFDPSLGTLRRASNSFGPLFAERAATIGRRRMAVGFNYQHASYDKFEGSSLDGGTIRFYLRHQDCCTTGTGPVVPPFFGVDPHPDGTLLNPFFEGDVIEAALSLKVKTDVVSLFGNYGLTDRWDVGIAVPIVHVDMDATVLATIKRLATVANPLIHTFVAGQDVPQTTIASGGSATGIGDIELRTKYRLLDLRAGGLAAAADFRLPTGNEDDLLGGSTQVKLFLIESGGSDRVTQHVNVGYTFSKDNGTVATGALGAPTFPDEFNYAAGVELVVEPRITVIGDVVGRTLRNAGRLDMVTKTFQFQPPGTPAPPLATMQFEEFEPRTGNLNLLYGTAGVKINPKGNILFSASVLFPLTDAGLKNRLTTIVGMDYAF